MGPLFFQDEYVAIWGVVRYFRRYWSVVSVTAKDGGVVGTRKEF